MRLRLLSRGSDLAKLQAVMVKDALQSHSPKVDVECLTRSSSGDRDRRVELWQSPNPGIFTTDLSEALLAGEAEIAVHSWKDLPVGGFSGTTIAGTLERADPRDVLLVRRDVVEARLDTLDVLTSSPRRAWQLQQGLAPLLPWRVAAVRPVPVRGNIPTRLARLASEDGHALVVAKAALDRLLLPAADATARRAVRHALDRHLWMVLPIQEFPTAPAQGALALEIKADRADLAGLASGVTHDPTRRAVDAERTILSGYGGGCHEAIGATVLIRDYGVVTSVRGRAPSGEVFGRWSLQPSSPLPPPASAAGIWPRPDERVQTTRRATGATPPVDRRGWSVARADAMPDATSPDLSRVIWTPGTRTWRRLAARGFWVHGCADGLGDAESPAVDGLAGRTMTWHRLTHAGSGHADAIATYSVETSLPADLETRTHFFWTSGSVFLEALRRHPGIGRAWHGCGPGYTSRVVRDTLGDPARVSIWLDYDQWHQHVNR